MVNKYFVIREEVIDVFHEKYYIPTREKMSFHISCVSTLCSMKYGKSRSDCFQGSASKNIYKAKKYYSEKKAKQQVYKYRINIGVEIDNYQ